MRNPCLKCLLVPLSVSFVAVDERCRFGQPESAITPLKLPIFCAKFVHKLRNLSGVFPRSACLLHFEYGGCSLTLDEPLNAHFLIFETLDMFSSVVVEFIDPSWNSSDKLLKQYHL